MDIRELKKNILHDLELGIIPNKNRYEVSAADFMKALKELASERKIVYNTIEDKSSPFYGDPKYIRRIIK